MPKALHAITAANTGMRITGTIEARPAVLKRLPPQFFQRSRCKCFAAEFPKPKRRLCYRAVVRQQGVCFPAMRSSVFMALAACLIASPTPARAATETEFQNWNGAILQRHLTPKPGAVLWLDMHLNSGADATSAIIRPGIGYDLSREVTVHVGYAWSPLFRKDRPRRDGHIIWQQIMWRDHLTPKFRLLLRFRPEQWLREDGKDLGHRWRGLAIAYLSPWPESRFMFITRTELFFHLRDTDWGAKQGFDQNRFMMGVGFPRTGGTRIELSYLNVFANRTPDDVMVHALSILFFWLH